MKKHKIAVLALFFLGIVNLNVFAQEPTESESPFSVGSDITSSYVWRGTKFSGPAIQPYLEYSIANLTVGSWGSFGFADQVAEADLYVSYGFDFGLSIGLTDYYYQGSPYFRYDTDSASHAFEVNIGYEISNFSASANYIINDASKGGPANTGSDLYFELSYAFKNFSAFVGAGNGWYTLEDPGKSDEFSVCNIGVSAEKEIKITDSFAIPFTGSVIVNPQAETFNIVGTLSF